MHSHIHDEELKWREIGPLESFSEGAIIATDVGGDALCIVRKGDKVWCFADQCPHAYQPLSHGTLEPGLRIRCRYHEWVFPLESDRRRAKTMPSLDFREIRVRDGVVEIRHPRSG